MASGPAADCRRPRDQRAGSAQTGPETGRAMGWRPRSNRAGCETGRHWTSVLRLAPRGSGQRRRLGARRQVLVSGKHGQRQHDAHGDPRQVEPAFVNDTHPGDAEGRQQRRRYSGAAGTWRQRFRGFQAIGFEGALNDMAVDDDAGLGLEPEHQGHHQQQRDQNRLQRQVVSCEVSTRVNSAAMAVRTCSVTRLPRPRLQVDQLLPQRLVDQPPL